MALQSRTQPVRIIRAGHRFGRWLQQVVLWWEHPLGSALLSGVVYAIFALAVRWHGMAVAYFNYLADAWLHGQLHLRVMPPTTHDLSLFEGRYYLYWPPFPALLLLPFVAIWGVGFVTIAFNLALAAGNVSLVALLLRQAGHRRLAALAPMRRGLLVLFFALGTVHLTLAPFGTVWFTAQLVGFACVALVYLAALGLRGLPAFVCAGLALACALATRNHLAFAGLWPAYYLLHQHRLEPRARRFGYVVGGMLPIVLVIALLAVYNQARFGSPLDNGLRYHQMDQRFVADYQRYGSFDLYYLPRNLFYQYLAYPFPRRSTSEMGGSLLLLSPVFFGAFLGLLRARPHANGWLLGASILLVALPILLLMGTGWRQWGPRYTLDFTVPLLLLTAIGIRRWPIWLLGLLTAVSIAHYVIGLMYFGWIL